jgi:hypothetical protein
MASVAADPKITAPKMGFAPVVASSKDGAAEVGTEADCLVIDIKAMVGAHKLPVLVPAMVALNSEPTELPADGVVTAIDWISPFGTEVSVGSGVTLGQTCAAFSTKQSSGALDSNFTTPVMSSRRAPSTLPACTWMVGLVPL